jgi:beta-glucosidase
LGFHLPIQAGDLETIAQKIDFIGINYYFEDAVAYDETAPLKYRNQPFWQDTSYMGWTIVPGGFKRLIRWFLEVPGGISIYIIENDYCRNDYIEADGRIHDKERIEYFKQHHLAVYTVLIKEGVNLKGYFA